MTEETKTIRLVYLGIARGKKTKRVHVWYPIDRAMEIKDHPPLPKHAWNNKACLCFSKVGRRAGSPGAVWEFEQTGDAISMSGTYIGFWPRSDQTREWQLHHHVLDNEIRRDGKAAKEMRQNVVFEALEPVRALYHSSSHALRVQMLAYIIEYIMRGKPHE